MLHPALVAPPPPAPDAGPARPAASGAPAAGWRAWAALGVAVLARMVRAALLTLVAVAMVPAVWHWTSYAVLSGSMEPSMSPGDIVVGKPLGADEKVPVGRVMVFTAPAEEGERLLVHRVIEKRDDGGWTTAGDANAGFDTSPVAREDFRSRAVLLVPYVALPFLWWSEGQYAAVLGAGLALSALFVLASLTGPRGGRHLPRGLVLRRTATAVLVSGAVIVLSITRAGGAVAFFSGTTTSASNSWTVPLRPDTYGNAVRADSPYFFWRFDEKTGPTARQDGGDTSRDGAYTNVASFTEENVVRTLGASVRLAGSSGRMVSTDGGWQANHNFTYEMWFKTTTTSGGKLMGYESSTNATSSKAERTLLMRNDGKLTYGLWSSPKTKYSITSPAAYNDGGWHHVVIASHTEWFGQYSRMYVDGALVAGAQTTAHTDFGGWFRVGYGTLPSGTGYPTSAHFSGSLDEPAIYGGTLSATRVKAHYDARSG